MHYTKPALTFEQQAQQLLDRGLIAPDKATLTACLQSVNYYRLSAYWYPFRRIDQATGDETFAPNTTLEAIWRRYSFDRELRLLVMDALERVEVAVLRTRLVEQFALRHGAFGYTDITNFKPGFSSGEHTRLLTEVSDSVNRSREEFVQRFRQKYSNESYLPLWITAEVMTFGHLFTIYRNLNRTEQQALSLQFKLYPPVLISWLHTLNFIRNVCAHHARLWNRELPIRPLVPDARNNPEWHTPFKYDNRRVFIVLSLLSYLLGFIDTQSDWQSRLEKLLLAYPEISIREMGFHNDWQLSSIWI